MSNWLRRHRRRSPDSARRSGAVPPLPRRRPRIARTEAKHLEVADVIALLAAADGLRYKDVLVLIAATGLRRGEALALRWRDVDLDNSTLKVQPRLAASPASW